MLIQILPPAWKVLCEVRESQGRSHWKKRHFFFFSPREGNVSDVGPWNSGIKSVREHPLVCPAVLKGFHFTFFRFRYQSIWEHRNMVFSGSG